MKSDDVFILVIVVMIILGNTYMHQRTFHSDDEVKPSTQCLERMAMRACSAGCAWRQRV